MGLRHEGRNILDGPEMFLTPEQLEDLTGLTQPAAQLRWLRKNGIEAYERADGKPRVPAAQFKREKPVPGGVSQPDFGALREAG
jgi:hypothetical protein